MTSIHFERAWEKCWWNGVNHATGSPVRACKSITNANAFGQSWNFITKIQNVSIYERRCHVARTFISLFLSLKWIRRSAAKKSVTVCVWHQRRKIYCNTYFLVMLMPSAFVPHHEYVSVSMSAHMHTTITRQIMSLLHGLRTTYLCINFIICALFRQAFAINLWCRHNFGFDSMGCDAVRSHTFRLDYILTVMHL